MRTRRPRVRRGAPPRRRSSTRTRGRARVHRQPARRRTTSTRRRVITRRRPNGRNARAPRPNLGKSLKAAIAAGVVVTVVVAVIAFLARGFPEVQPVRITDGTRPVMGLVAGQFIYTA